MKKTTSLAAALLLAAMSLAGCSGAPSADKAVAPPSSSVAAPGTSPKPVEQAADATALATTLKGKIPEITKVTTVTEDNDQNNLIGRPGQYVSAVWITDNRGRAGETGVDGGAVIETFANVEDMQARAGYIEKVTKGMGALAEYHYTSGPSLLRVSGKLTPTQAKAYEAAFAQK